MHVSLTSALVVSEWSDSSIGRLTPAENTADTHSVGGSVGLRIGLEDMDKWKFLILSGLKSRPLEHEPVASLYTVWAIELNTMRECELVA
jgi:hypothetical protein